MLDQVECRRDLSLAHVAFRGTPASSYSLKSDFRVRPPGSDAQGNPFDGRKSEISPVSVAASYLYFVGESGGNEPTGFIIVYVWYLDLVGLR